jgi:heme o synthase
VSSILPAPGEVQVPAPSPAGPWIDAPERSRLRDYLYLTKARLSLMVVASGVVGYWLGASTLDPFVLLSFTLGTFLLVGGANAFNQIVERELDARMERTANRPIPTGRISLHEAKLAAAAMSTAGTGLLFAACGWLTSALGIVAFLVYVLVYTPLKTRSSWATVPGAVSGAIPTLMGWSAAEGSLGLLGWCLFGILFFWQFPHTWAIAATYRDDYERVGYRALPKSGLKLETLAATLALVATSLLPSLLGLAGLVYLGGAVVLGALFLAAAIRFGSGTERRRASGLLAMSLFYLPLMLTLVAFDAGRVV